MSQVLSVHVGRPRTREWAGIGRTSIEKTTVSGAVMARFRGLEGDQVSDTRHHGGSDKALYAFAREDLDRWVERLGQPIADGTFGENLTTRGIDVNEAEVGERWEVGGALLEVRAPRIPCNDFKGWMDLGGYDATAWVRRFTEVARPGPYLRVLAEGPIGAGDEIRVAHRPGHGVTLSMMFRALTTERGLLPRVLEVPDLVDEVRVKAEDHVTGLDTRGRIGAQVTRQ